MMQGGYTIVYQKEQRLLFITSFFTSQSVIFMIVIYKRGEEGGIHMDYDVLILGGGIIGCAAAYELSKYSLNIALIEKDYDIADDVALINSSIIYDGVECENTLMAKLEMMGNRMFDELSSKFKIPFKRSGSLMIASDEKEEKRLQRVYERAVDRGIGNIYMLSGREVYEMEPNLNIQVKKAIYSENTGVVCPYDLAIAYAEVASENGVSFRLEEEVLNLQKISRGFKVVTNKNKFTCKVVLDTTPSKYDYRTENDAEAKNGLRSYLKYFLMEKSFSGTFSNIIFTVNQKGDRLFSVPTVQGNLVVALNTKEDVNYTEAYEKITSLIGSVEEQYVNGYYQSPFYNDEVLIDDSAIDKGYIKVNGKRYSEVTMTPSIAKMVCETIVSNVGCILKKDFNDKRREFYRFAGLTKKEKKKIIKVDRKYGNIVCLCQQITEGEIVDAIRRPLGARTVEGIKRRTGATLGSCQGSYCINKIVTILAREMNKNLNEVVKESKNSKIVLSRIKEFDGV